MTKGRILVVDDEPAMLENCRRLLSAEGYACWTLAEPLRFQEVFRELGPDVLLLDLRMPGVDGMAVLAAGLAEDPALPVVVITGYASVASAVQAMREGAFDYLAKPFTADQLAMAVGRAVRYRSLAVENRALRERVEWGPSFYAMVGTSLAFVRLLEQARRVAETDANVLISGESGTGKEMLARFIHEHSPRRNRPFVPVDCAALPEGLLESELFGHERGAFTGAVSRKSGLLAEAHGGTVFLDEITEPSVGLQSKLLRALEERKLRRLGSTALIEIDVRILAATNVDLEAALAAGTFRRDLYYRLNVVHFEVPPLRAREGDIGLLAQTFLQQFAHALGRAPPRVSPAVWEALERYTWPGNVRELRNLAQRLIVLDEDGRIRLANLPLAMRGGWTAARGGADDGTVPDYETARADALRAFKTSYLRQLLAAHGGNVSRAARAAGVSRRTVHRWLAEVGPLALERLAQR